MSDSVTTMEPNALLPQTGQKIIQHSQTLLEQTGLSSTLKHWAVDSIKDCHERRHNTLVHGTNRQIIGSAATALILSIGGSFALSVGAACLPAGIAIGVMTGIAALVSSGFVIAGIRRNYKDRKLQGDTDHGKFVKDTFQNITCGAIQALIPEEKIAKWEEEKNQHLEKKNLTKALKNLKDIPKELTLTTTNTISDILTNQTTNTDNYFTKKINSLSQVKNELEEGLNKIKKDLNITEKESTTQTIKNNLNYLKDALNKQLDFFQKAPDIYRTQIDKLNSFRTQIDELNNNVSSIDESKITELINTCIEQYATIEAAIKNPKTVINDSEIYNITLELVQNRNQKEHAKYKEAVTKYNNLNKETKEKIRNLIAAHNNNADKLISSLKAKTLPTVEEFFKQEIQKIEKQKQANVQLIKTEIQNQLSTFLNPLDDVINNTYKFNLLGNETNESIAKTNDSLNESLQKIKEQAQTYKKQINTIIDECFKIESLTKENIEEQIIKAQAKINEILKQAKEQLQDMPKDIENTLRKNAADFNIGTLNSLSRNVTNNINSSTNINELF